MLGKSLIMSRSNIYCLHEGLDAESSLSVPNLGPAWLEEAQAGSAGGRATLHWASAPGQPRGLLRRVSDPRSERGPATGTPCLSTAVVGLEQLEAVAYRNLF